MKEDAAEERESYEVALMMMDGACRQKELSNGKRVEESRERASKTNANCAESVKKIQDKSKAKLWKTKAEAKAEYQKQAKKYADQAAEQAANHDV